jgi:hypothetical protein
MDAGCSGGRWWKAGGLSRSVIPKGKAVHVYVTVNEHEDGHDYEYGNDYLVVGLPWS